MDLKWFRILTIAILTITNSKAFSDNECLNSSFDTVVTHKAAPFGLTQNTLKVSKKNCVIDIHHNKLKFLTKNWIIDVCRSPVHIKINEKSISVEKRSHSCSDGAKKGFCSSYKKIDLILQDDGLIFADGEKEDIKTDHGRIYCAYLLVQKYLDQGIVFNRKKNYDDAVLNTSPSVTPPSIEKKEGDDTPSNSNSEMGTF